MVTEWTPNEWNDDWKIAVHAKPTDWESPITKLVHNVLYREACKQGPKALAAEKELVDRGDFARANMAVMVRTQRAERFLRNLYMEKILDPDQLSRVWGDSPA